MRKMILMILTLALSLSLFSCGSEYKPVKSTKEELRIMYTMTLDGEEYEVPYELYRTFFLQLKPEIDGGDETVWTGSSKEEYIENIDKMIFAQIADIYAVFHLCKKAGIDVYSDIVDESIEDYVKASVEGGSVDGMEFEGFDGDYDAYLSHLKSINMNYSVQELLFRYSAAYVLLESYYSAKITDGESFDYTREDIKAFYDSDDCVRVLQAFLTTATETDRLINTLERAEKIRYGVSAQSNESDVATYMIANTLANESLRNGVVIGKYSLDSMYYKKLTEAAFSLSLYETSEVIEIITGTSDGYYIIYRTDKSDIHFEECYDDIESVFIQNLIGEKVSTTTSALVSSIETTDAFSKLDRSAISMN